MHAKWQDAHLTHPANANTQQKAAHLAPIQREFLRLIQQTISGDCVTGADATATANPSGRRLPPPDGFYIIL